LLGPKQVESTLHSREENFLISQNTVALLATQAIVLFPVPRIVRRDPHPKNGFGDIKVSLSILPNRFFHGDFVKSIPQFL
jgi:hypothetical protein